MFFFFYSSHKRSRKGIWKYKLIMKSMYHKRETIKSSSGVKELKNRICQMQWSGIPDDLYYNAWDKSIWKILRTSPKEGIFVFLNLNSARRTLRLNELTQNKLRIILYVLFWKSQNEKIFVVLIRFDAPFRQKELRKRSRCPESHRTSSNLSRRCRTSRSLLNFHFTYWKRRPRSGSRAVNSPCRRLFRHGS